MPNLITNPTYDPTKPTTSANQPYIFENPQEIINPQTGQTAQQASGQIINSDLLTPTASLDLPLTPEEPNYQASLGAIPSIGSIMASPETPTEKTQTDLESRLLEAYQKISGKQAAQTQAEQTAGLPGFQSQLTDINSQIQTLQKEAMQIPLKLQQQAEGRGITAGGLAPIQTGLLRENTIKALGLSAIAQTLQGNIATAQNTANRAIELEFAPEQAKIDYLTKALDINMSKLNREDQKKAQAQQTLLQERQRVLDQQKEDRGIILGWVAEASKNQAPAVIINQALSLSDPRQAMSLLSPYFFNPLEKEATLADLDYKRAQIEGIKSSMELDKLKTTADIAATKSATALGWARFQADQEATKNLKLTTADLSNTQLTKVQTIANQFDSEQAVKNYQTSAEAIDAVRSAGTSPTDDIQRVYAFAKVMDPNSVVREGEYKTIQDYSTALLERMGLKAKRVFDNSGFLTQEARGFMLKTLNNRLLSSEKAYKNIYDEYGRRINMITGNSDGSEFLTDYSKAFSIDLKSQVEIKGYNYDQMKADGYSDEEIKQSLGI